MLLPQLVEGLADLVPGDGPQPEITLIADDSRQVAAGALFAAVPGTSRPGISFAEAAMAAGAVALLVDAADVDYAKKAAPGAWLAVVRGAFRPGFAKI